MFFVRSMSAIAHTAQWTAATQKGKSPAFRPVSHGRHPPVPRRTDGHAALLQGAKAAVIGLPRKRPSNDAVAELKGKVDGRIAQGARGTSRLVASSLCRAPRPRCRPHVSGHTLSL